MICIICVCSVVWFLYLFCILFNWGIYGDSRGPGGYTENKISGFRQMQPQFQVVEAPRRIIGTCSPLAKIGDVNSF